MPKKKLAVYILEKQARSLLWRNGLGTRIERKTKTAARDYLAFFCIFARSYSVYTIEIFHYSVKTMSAGAGTCTYNKISKSRVLNFESPIRSIARPVYVY
jgi:hypothetical protein